MGVGDDDQAERYARWRAIGALEGEGRRMLIGEYIMHRTAVIGGLGIKWMAIAKE